MEITDEIARNVLSAVDGGMVSGLWDPGEERRDTPERIALTLRTFTVGLNYAASWPDSATRAKGMRRLTLAQLGSRGHLDEIVLAGELADLANSWTDGILYPKAHAIYAQAWADNAATYAAVADGTHVASDTDDAHIAARAAAAHAAHAANAVAYVDATYAASNVGHRAQASYVPLSISHIEAAAMNASIAAGSLSRMAEDVVQLLIHLKAPGAKWLELAPR